MTSGSDDELLAHAGAGSEPAWRELFRRHQGRLFRFAWRLSGSRELAEDAVQETFLLLMEQRFRYDPGRGTLGAYLLGVVRNKALRLRDRHYAGAATLDAVHAVAAGRDPESDAGRAQSAEALRQAVQALPEAYREALLLCDLEELSYEEAARVIECPVGTVRSRLHRARQLLMERMTPVGERGAK